MSDSTAQGQSANSSGRNDSARRRHPKRMRGMIDIAPCASAADRDSARSRIDPRIFYRARSMTSPSSQMPKPPALCPPPRIATRRSLALCEVHGVNDVGHVRTTGNQPRFFVDHSVVHLASFIVIFVARFDQSAAKVCFEIGDGIFLKHDEVSAKRSYGQDGEVSAFSLRYWPDSVLCLPIAIGDV